MSAVAMEPDDQHCNPLVRASGARKTSIIIGAVVTFITCAYTTTRAATYGLALGNSGSKGVRLEDDGEAGDGSHGMVSTQPESRKAMRAEALRRAVESGALPASALDGKLPPRTSLTSPIPTNTPRRRLRRRRPHNLRPSNQRRRKRAHPIQLCSLPRYLHASNCMDRDPAYAEYWHGPREVYGT
jgi:hypothetical protein